MLLTNLQQTISLLDSIAMATAHLTLYFGCFSTIYGRVYLSLLIFKWRFTQAGFFGRRSPDSRALGLHVSLAATCAVKLLTAKRNKRGKKANKM